MQGCRVGISGIWAPSALGLFPWEPEADRFALPSAAVQGNSIYPEIPGACSHWEHRWCHKQFTLAPESVTLPLGWLTLELGCLRLELFSLWPRFSHPVIYPEFPGPLESVPTGSIDGARRALQQPRLAPECITCPEDG